MRIAYIAGSTIPSLTANSMHVMKMCQAITQEGHDLTLYVARYLGTGACDEDDLWEHYAIKQHFPIWWLASKPDLRGYGLAIRAVRQLSQRSTDLVYTRHPAAAALSSLLGYCTIYELHDMPGGRVGPWFLRFFLAGKGFVRLIAISEALRHAVLARYPSWFNNREFVVAHDGVDLERFTDLPTPEAARERLDLSPKLTVGYSGSLYAGRGIELILELAQSFPDVQFLILGGDPRSVEERRKQVVQCGLSNLHFLGFISNTDLPIYLSACDVLLMPYQHKVSVSSGGDTSRYMSPLKLFEYMAVQRLIISSDLPVLHEVLNERNAVFCPPEDVSAWRRAVTRSLADVSWRTMLARQARIDVERYTWRRRVRTCLHQTS